GGGQLGTFFAVAAKRLGYRVVVWDPDPDAPARCWADRFVCAPFDDTESLRAFLLGTSGVTYEREAVPVDLVEAIERLMPVRPGSRALRVLQNRITQKSFLTEQGLPTPVWRALGASDALPRVAAELGFPCVCKTATAGYDGRGQWRLPDPHIAEDVSRSLGAVSAQARSADGRWIIEAWVPFQKELSVVVARGDHGDLITYPVVENVHEGGILRTSLVPADIDAERLAKTTSLAAEAIHALGESGVFCVEMFLHRDGTLLINEIAPRPHNSGHYSMDVCTVDQFEQQVRVLCGLPLLHPRLLSPAVMVNILGSEISRLQSPHASMRLLSLPGARVYHYRKRASTAGRKMGHILLTDEDPLQAMARAEQIQRLVQKNRMQVQPPEKPRPPGHAVRR
ncbi:MAG: 5-(carboxyamino)imidazole ribonucleotide synthase, partial [Nitrospiria bacterium]